MLLHTRLKDGQGRELLRVKTTRVIGFWHDCVAGVAKDTERFYVAVWSARGRGLVPTFLLPEERRPANSPRYYSALEVRVFALVDGRFLHKAAVPGAPAAIPVETAAGPGPLKVVKGGADCHGTQLCFEGTNSSPATLSGKAALCLHNLTEKLTGINERVETLDDRCRLSNTTRRIGCRWGGVGIIKKGEFWMCLG